MFSNDKINMYYSISHRTTWLFALSIAGLLITFPEVQSLADAQLDDDQTITQIAQQVAAENPNTSQGEIEQTIQQIATQTSEAGGDPEQAILQVAQQVASSPSGPVSQSITQIAQQFASGETSSADQAITQIAQQTAQGGNIAQRITQSAIQLALGSPVASQQITQIAQQIAQQTGSDCPCDIEQTILQIAANPSGPVSQSIVQIAKQTAGGGGGGGGTSSQQRINQVAQQVAQGGNAVQIIIQIAI